MADRLPEYYAARRKAAEWVNTYQRVGRNGDNFRVTCLERALDAQREAAKLEAAFTEALAPCRMCGRKVDSPCHDAEGYYEGGPWDGSCEAWAKGRSDA